MYGGGSHLDVASLGSRPLRRPSTAPPTSATSNTSPARGRPRGEPEVVGVTLR